MIILYYVLAIIVSALFGIWLRETAADELKSGRKWIILALVLGIFGAVVFYFLGQAAASLTCFALAIISGISLKRRR